MTMVEEKKVARVVAHGKLYMHVGGKLTHIPKGTELTVTKAQCKALGAKLADPSKAKKVDATVKGGAHTESDEQLAAELEATKAELKKTQEALTQTATKLDVAQKALKAKK